MNTENPVKSNISSALEIFALVAVVTTPIFFIVGHLSAYFYFSSFDIQYFKYADTYTAFSFALESVEIVLSVIAIGAIVAISILIINSYSNLCKDAITAKARIKCLAKSFPKFLLILFLITFVAMQLISVVSSRELKEEILNKQYIPYEISFDSDKMMLKCVTSIGSIGQFQVFLNQRTQPHLVAKDSLIYIKQLFAPVPLKRITRGKSSVDNPNYDEEMKIWLAKWNSVCGVAEINSFEKFKFTENGLQRHR